MDLEGLQSFVFIAKEKSISKAASLLHVTQPTLSARIRKLEEGMGVKLLERSWDGVRLTEQGHFFLYYAIQMVGQLHDASAMISKVELSKFSQSIEEVTRRDRLVIGLDTGLSGVLMDPLASALQQIHPNLKCKYVSHSSMTLIDLVEYGAIDIGVFYEVKECRLSTKLHLLDDEWVLLCSEELYDAAQDGADFVELVKNEMFVLFENPIATYVNVWETLLGLFGTMPDKFQIVDSCDMMLGVVANAQGYTFVPKTYIPPIYLAHYPIRMISFRDRLPALPIKIAYSNSVPFDVPAEVLRERLSKLGAAVS
jgi:Transcriptional regulator